MTDWGQIDHIHTQIPNVGKPQEDSLQGASQIGLCVHEGADTKEHRQPLHGRPSDEHLVMLAYLCYSIGNRIKPTWRE